MSERALFPKRRRPSHATPVRRHNCPIILLVTITVVPRGEHLANGVFARAFLSACREADAWSVGEYVIMPDHVHMFCQPARLQGIDLRVWLRYLKRRTGIHLGTVPWHWQADCWDRQMRDQSHYARRWAYVQQNPVRRGLVARPEDWAWQGQMNRLEW